MIRRIQIASRIGNVYYGTDGGAYYTMGDYAPSINDYVWTNGKYIYGHQTGGGGIVITTQDKYMPVIGWQCGLGSYRFSYDSWGTGLYYARIINDNNFCYVTKDDYTSNYKTFYDVFTGEKIADMSNDTVDVDIADDGGLLTCDVTGYYVYNNTPFVDMPNYFFDHRFVNGAEKIILLDAEDIYDAVESEQKNDMSVNVYKNGKVWKSHDVGPAAIDSIKTMCKNIVDTYQNDGDTFPKGRVRPNGFVRHAIGAITNVHIQGDGSYDAFINASATGFAFPYVKINRDSWVFSNGKFSVKNMGDVDVWMPVEITVSASYHINSDGALDLIKNSYTVSTLGMHINTKKTIGDADTAVYPVKTIGNAKGAQFLFHRFSFTDEKGKTIYCNEYAIVAGLSDYKTSKTDLYDNWNGSMIYPYYYLKKSGDTSKYYYIYPYGYYESSGGTYYNEVKNFKDYGNKTINNEDAGGIGYAWRVQDGYFCKAKLGDNGTSVICTLYDADENEILSQAKDYFCSVLRFSKGCYLIDGGMYMDGVPYYGKSEKEGMAISYMCGSNNYRYRYFVNYRSLKKKLLDFYGKS